MLKSKHTSCSNFARHDIFQNNLWIKKAQLHIFGVNCAKLFFFWHRLLCEHRYQFQCIKDCAMCMCLSKYIIDYDNPNCRHSMIYLLYGLDCTTIVLR